MVKPKLLIDDYHLFKDIFELALIKEAIKQKKPPFLCLSVLQCCYGSVPPHQDIEIIGRTVQPNTHPTAS